MKTDYIKLFIVLFLTLAVQALSAQSIRMSDGKELARMLTEDSFEMEPAGVVSYKLEQGQFIMLFENMPYELGPLGSYEIKNDIIQYFDKRGNIIGYFNTTQGRLSRVSANQRSIDIEKGEDTAATLLDGILLRNESEEGAVTRFTVDDNFSRTIIGFIFLYVIG